MKVLDLGEGGRHAPKCKFRDETTDSSSKRMKYDGKFMLAAGRFPPGCTKLLLESVLQLGAQLLEKRGAEKANQVSQKMRFLAGYCRKDAN